MRFELEKKEYMEKRGSSTPLDPWSLPNQENSPGGRLKVEKINLDKSESGKNSPKEHEKSVGIAKKKQKRKS